MHMPLALDFYPLIHSVRMMLVSNAKTAGIVTGDRCIEADGTSVSRSLELVQSSLLTS